MAKESIEEKLGVQYTSNDVVETRINLKINKNASRDDADAFAMLDYLKDKNINLSKHIRLLLALEYRGEIYLNDKYQIIDIGHKTNDISHCVDTPVSVTIEDDSDMESNDSIPPSDDDL